MRITKLKEDAIDRLSGRWLLMVSGIFVYSIITICFNLIINYGLDGRAPDIVKATVSLIYNLTISPMMALGLIKYIMDFYKRENGHDLGIIFSGYKDFWKLDLLGLIVGAVVVIVTAIVAGICYLLYKTTITEIFVLITVILAIILLVALCYVSLRLFSSIYLIAEENVGVIKAIKKSWVITKGNVFKLFLLPLSFLGWSLLILPIIIIGIILAIVLKEVYFPMILFGGIAAICEMFLSAYMRMTYVGTYFELNKIYELKQNSED
ncbi:MAG: DUF975 family protein [Clostridium sp.]|nr:DUF975 family protein [Clostridium sp.]